MLDEPDLDLVQACIDHHPRAHLCRPSRLVHHEAMDIKEKLPFPYNQDLAPVLQGLARRTPQGRSRLANDPVTAGYLAAGMRLLERQLGHWTDEPDAGSASHSTCERPLLRLLSQRAVADEVANNHDPFVRVGSTSTLRATWRSQSDYVADLLRFGLWSQHYRNLYADDLANRAEGLLEAPDVVKAIHLAAYANLASSIEESRFRLQLLATATAEGDPVIGQAMTENYQEITQTWQPVFAELLHTRGLRLRPGITLDDMTCLLIAAVEGLSLRALADSSTKVLDENRQECLVGVFALAFLVGCTQPEEDADGLTLEQALEEMLRQTKRRAEHAFGKKG
jgi:hypothetical protein